MGGMQWDMQGAIMFWLQQGFQASFQHQLCRAQSCQHVLISSYLGPLQDSSQERKGMSQTAVGIYLWEGHSSIVHARNRVCLLGPWRAFSY